MEEGLKYKIFLNVVPISGVVGASNVFTGNTTDETVGSTFGILSKNKTVVSANDSDFFLNIPLFKTNNIHEYIDQQNDKQIRTIERQNFNPYFLEFGFFDSLRRNTTKDGFDLNKTQIEYIKSVRPGLAEYFIATPETYVLDQDIVLWFNRYGVYELPWGGNITMDDIIAAGKDGHSLLYKASVFNIDINR